MRFDDSRIVRARLWLLPFAAAATCTAVLVCAAPPHAPAAYRWVDETGVVHYGDRVPAQYAQQETTMLNREGVEVGHKAGQKSTVQLEQEAREQQQLQQQKQHDSFLLATYASVRDIEQLRDWMLEQGRRRGGKPGTGLGARSVRLTLGRLSAAFEQACQDGRLAANPCRYVKLPSQVQREDTTWSESQLKEFLHQAAAGRLAACWLLSALGLRRGEILGLKWSDISIAEGTLTIARAISLPCCKSRWAPVDVSVKTISSAVIPPSSTQILFCSSVCVNSRRSSSGRLRV